jgi:transketolase
VTGNGKDGGDLNLISRQVRGTVVNLSHQAQSAHLGSSLSCVDILVAALWGGLDLSPKGWRDSNRDHLVFSKGHGAMALYATLAHRGYFPIAELDRYATDGSLFAEHPPPRGIPGVEAATGSLGHGLSLSLGMALAFGIRGQRPRCLTVMSDGECNEGSVWEAAMFAPAHDLENVAVVVDYNRWQATGRSDEIMALSPLRDKWAAFGWSASEVDGHDPTSLRDAFLSIPDGTGRPVAFIANTVKGRGISFMEDDNNWHYRAPTEEERLLAHRELGLI